MVMIKRFLLLLIFSILPYLLVAQFYVLGEDPSSIHWKQINTAQFQVIYPADFESKAQRMASLLSRVYAFGENTLDHTPKKISVILHTNTVRSNGVVAWAPARMELFTTPHQEMYAQDWLEQLAIHEYRHVVQIDKIQSELPGIFRFLLGEQAAAIVTGMYLPFWFLEGDAVVTETALSQSGRGRVPSFEMEIKANSVEKKRYSYNKAYLGSFKDYIPNYYQLGYQMVGEARRLYGADTWAKVLHHVSHAPLSLNAFSSGLKSATGLNQVKLYDTIFTGLKHKWVNEVQSIQPTSFQYISALSKGYASYRYPFQINDSSYFAVKYSLDALTKFVSIDLHGQEKTLFTPGSFFEESITYGRNTIYWVETKTDVRWNHREFSQLRMLDLSTGLLVEKTYKDKLYAPCLSPNGQSLAAIKIDQQNDCSIVLVDPQNGEIKRKIKLSRELFLFTPSWGDNNLDLYAIVLSNKGKSLAKISTLTGEVTLLMPYAYNELKRPVYAKNTIYYVSSATGIDEVYGLDLMSNQHRKLTTSRFGVRDVQLSTDTKSLLYCRYGADGFKVVKSSNNPGDGGLQDYTKSFTYPLAAKLSLQEHKSFNFSIKDSATYQGTPYSKFGNSLNFHSWSPAYVDLSNQELRPGVSVMSQNKLSTILLQLGYDYSALNKTGKWRAEFDYTGLFPVFKLRSDYGQENSYYYRVDTYNNLTTHTARKDTQKVAYSYHIMNLNGIVNLPLNLTHGKWNRLLQPEFQIGYKKMAQAAATPIANSNSTWLTYRLYAHNLLQTSLRDMQPAIGQVIDLNYHYSTSGSSGIRSIGSAEGTIYFPGFFNHHGFRFYGGFQDKSTSVGYLSDYLSYPRGYMNFVNNRLVSFKSDYVLPIFYPDLSIGGLSYIKRIALRLFYDQGWATVPNHQNTINQNVSFQSVGGEWTADCNFFRLYVPTKIGIRTSYLVGQQTFVSEFLLSIDFGAL
jgi:hypothetical protein